MLAACGHEIETPERVWKRKRARERVCPECHRAQQAQETLIASRRMGLCLLSGSDRQVLWAYRIRYGAIWAAAALLVGYRSVSTEADAALLAELRDGANRHRSAAWWIGCRKAPAEALLAECDYTEHVVTCPELPYAPPPF